MLSIFKSTIVVVILLLFTQQSIAAYAPMKCDDMKIAMMVSSDKNSHSTSQMTMYGHDSLSKDKNHSHEECEICDSSDCICGEIGSYFSSTISISAQDIQPRYTLFVDNGNKFISQDSSPNSGVYLNLFRPPIHI